MTHPASPDGTGTQTDEVRAALDRLHMLAKIEQLADRASVTADILSGAASVLSAEIERLTRRAEAAEARLDEFDVCMCGSLIKDHNVGSGHSPVSMYDYHLQQAEERAQKAEAALASAAAPDERVLAERERCGLVALRVRDEQPKGSVPWHALDLAATAIRSNSPIRTPPHE